MPQTPTGQERFEANLAIVRAIGLDPQLIRPGLTITLDRELGPIVSAEFFLHNKEGHIYAINDAVATELKRFKLVPIDEQCLAAG